MKKGIFIFILLSFILCGCWDQQLLREVTMISSIGIDKGEDGMLNYTVVGGNIEENAEKRLQIISTSGRTPNDARSNIDRKIPELMSPAKVRILMLSDELAKEPIYPILDVFYRDPKEALNAKLAIIQGDTDKLLRQEYPDKPQVVDYAVDLIDSEEEATGVIIETIQSICPILFDPGQDILLPYLKAAKNEIILIGLALFDKEVMTGSLDPSESTLFLLMSNQRAKTAFINQKIAEDRTPSYLNYVSINVLNSESKMKVSVNNNKQINVNIELSLKADVVEYPHDQLDTEKEVADMANILSERLTEQAGTVIQKLQEANCDGFGIGRSLIAFHNDTWNQINWKEAYSKVQFTPKVNVEIIRHGIIN